MAHHNNRVGFILGAYKDGGFVQDGPEVGQSHPGLDDVVQYTLQLEYYACLFLDISMRGRAQWMVQE